MKKDIISEEEYNFQLPPTAARPEDDSPGDSEDDAEAEFLVGLNYMPEEDNEISAEERREVIFSDRKSKHSGEESPKKEKEIPATAKIVSSDQPAPWLDLGTPSDTH